MTIDGTQGQAHRDHRDVGTAGIAPGIDLRLEVVDAAPRECHIVPAEVVDRPVEAGYAVACAPGPRRTAVGRRRLPPHLASYHLDERTEVPCRIVSRTH